MATSEISRFSRKVANYFWDPLPRNEDPSPIWCLGRSYDSRYRKTTAAPGTSPSAHSDSSTSQADSAVVTEPPAKPTKDDEDVDLDAMVKSQADLTRSEEESLGWPSDFLDDLESRIWMTYRRDFASIAKSSDPSAGAGMSFATKLRAYANQGFSTDTGWGCMIRSAQSLLANSLITLQLGRDWRRGEDEEKEREVLGLFADTAEAPFSIHKFVEHGAQACRKHPGEWFGPSAAARCLQALTNKYSPAKLRVYARPDDSDIYLPSLLSTATQMSADDSFEPTLIVLGTRLGINGITPAYHTALKHALELPQSVGIAGGRPSASHYFIGHQNDQFFYLDPHSTRPMLSASPTAEEVDAVHTRRVRRLGISEMDPSMLIGFLIHTKQELEEWRKAVEGAEGKSFIHFHDQEPSYSTGASGGGGVGHERPEAVDEVETWDETGDEDK